MSGVSSVAVPVPGWGQLEAQLAVTVRACATFGWFACGWDLPASSILSVAGLRAAAATRGVALIVTAHSGQLVVEVVAPTARLVQAGRALPLWTPRGLGLSRTLGDDAARAARELVAAARALDPTLPGAALLLIYPSPLGRGMPLEWRTAAQIGPAAPADPPVAGHRASPEADQPTSAATAEERSTPSIRRARRRVRRALTCVAALAVVGAAASGTYWWHHRTPDPTTVALPATPTAEEQAAVRDYLTTGAGIPLVAFARAADTDLPAARADRCSALADRLAQAGEPQQLLDAAARAPHPATRDAAMNAVGDMLDFVSACGQDSEQADDAAARFSVVVLRRLLEAEGVQV